MAFQLIFRSLAGTYGILVSGFLLLPTFVVVPLAFSSGQFLVFPPPGFSTKWFFEFFADPLWRAALIRSLVVAGCSAGIAVPVGIMVSTGIVRARSRVGRVIEPLTMLPMMVPIVIFAFALYVMSIQLDIDGGLYLLTLAHAVLSLPFVVVTVTASLSTFDPNLVLAAKISGATAFQAYRRVVIPTIAPGIAAATLIALMMSLDEPVIATFIAGDTPTLPAKMFSSIIYGLNPLVPVAATVLTAVTMILLLCAALLFVRSKQSRVLQ